MRRQYVLIKEYPCSPKKGSIATFSDFEKKYIIGYKLIGPITHQLDPNCIENQPEFWKKLTIEWEITVSIKSIISKVKYTKQDGRTDSFSVGDRLVYMIGSTAEEPKIESFSVDKDGAVLVSLIRNRTPAIIMHVEALASFKHSNPVLFTSIDGVEIRSGETVFGVSTNLILHEFSDWTHYHGVDGAPKNNGLKMFADKSNALEFIKLNNKKYSIQDILDAIDLNFAKDSSFKMINLELLKIEVYE